MKYLGKHKIFDDLMIGGVLLTPPDPASYAYELTLPNDDGTSGQVLTTDGNGLLTWTTNGSGTITSVDVSGGSTGLTTSGGPITSSGTITIGGTLAVGSGGTGLGTVGNGEILTGNGTSPLTSESTLTYDGARLTHTMTPSGSFTGYAATATTAAGWASGTNTGYGIVNTLNKDENTAGGTNTYTSIHNDINDTATNNTVLTQLIAVQNDINYANDAPSGTVNAWGTINNITNGDIQVGVKNVLTGGATAATTYGIHQKIDDGGYDLYFLSSDATTIDYFSLATGASGQTDITTVDGGGAAAHLNFDIDGDINFDSHTKHFNWKYDGTSYIYWDIHGSNYKWMAIGNQNDYFNINVGAEGATTLSTVDADTEVAHLTLDIDGDIELNADGGNITFKDGSDLHAEFAFGDPSLRIYGQSGDTGALHLYEDSDNGSNYIAVRPPTNVASNKIISFPDTAGTVALTSDIPDETVSTGTFVLKQTKVTMDATACNNLNSSPTTLVAAQGADTLIIPVDVVILVDYNSAQSVNCDLIVGYNGTTSYQYAIRYVRRFMYGVSTDMTMHLVPYLGNAANSLTGGVNVPLTISTSAAITGGSLTSITAYTSYYVIDNS